MKRHIKMIGIDLDGTFLTTNKDVPGYSQKILKKAIDTGITIVVATGRPALGIPQVIREIPGIRYAVVTNGARVIDLQEDKVLMEQLLAKEKAKKALEIFSKYDTLQEVYYDGQGYAPKDKIERINHYHHNPHMWKYVRQTRKPIPDVHALVEQEDRDLEKTQAIFADMDERAMAWAELQQVEGITVVTSLHYNIEVNGAGVNKGTGLLALGEMLGIDRGEIMAIGDSDNDIAMLRHAKFSVAMANAIEEVKAVADYITLTNDEEGAAKAIEKFCL